ncbi:hypothetical protein [Klebsiella pneumoniae]|uniref:hypothetical protein n=1 Tax=Klebsiella pneumoniae TaxID=573 RepID=UPI001C80426E|nr:hypothetical protein [Klebsiella pneumoniae]MBX4527634.1 hypothetical protein [Klebsiella pneumoniae]
MAEKFDIFAGSYVSVYYNSNVDNTQFDSDEFVEIPETGAFPQTGIEREVITAPNYTHKYSRKLAGRGSVPDIDLTVNYIPESIHDQLYKLAEDGKRGQFKIVYWLDATKTTGVGKVYNGFLSNATFGGGETEVTSLALTLSVDGGPVASGVITPSA